MKGYAEMSDWQIAEEVAKFIELGDRKQKGEGILYVKNNVWTRFDPCSNPADAWPILLENHIAIAPYKNATPCAWPSAEGLISKHVTEDVNPLRAVMITFLKMKESEND